jgi:hypothetical protein
MKRRDFLTRMRNRRRGDQLDLREPEARRATDWRTLRVELPAVADDDATTPIAVGSVDLLSDGIRLEPSGPCWVRGYRMWHDEDGTARAEFQYRPVDAGAVPPPGAVALGAGETWQPASA